MTPKEILEESDDKHPYDLGMAMVTERAALEAMEVYANEVAIGFAEWMDENGYTRLLNGYWMSLNEVGGKPVEELYNLYLQSKTI